MTNDELKEYYANLLIMQYEQKAKARATIKALIGPMIMNQLPTQVQDAFDVDTAVGVQLDIIGKYQGVVRSAYSFTGPVTLDDSDFRTMIKIAIIKNTFGSSLAEIQDLIHQFFPGSLLVFDYQNMRMSYMFSSAIGSMILAEVFVRSQFLPRPMGVQMASLIYIPDVDNLFGFGTYETAPYNIHGFNTYQVYDLDAPWLRYENAIYY